MRNLLLGILALLVPSVGISTEIRDTIVVSKEIKPDIYCVSLSVSSRGDSESTVLQALSETDAHIRALNLTYTGGKFTVFPSREWIPEERKYRIVGFVGRINYRFTLKKPSQQEEIIKALEEVKRRVPVNYTISSVGWCISKPLMRKVQQELKIEALKEAKLEALLFGRELRSKCNLEKVDLSIRRFPTPYEAIKAESLKSPKPPQSNQNMEMKASVLINCKQEVR